MPRLIFGIIVMAVMAMMASKKGFNPWLWILAGGLIGFLILVFLPSANENGIDEATRAVRVKRGNTVGMIISIIAIILIIVIIAVLFNL